MKAGSLLLKRIGKAKFAIWSLKEQCNLLISGLTGNIFCNMPVGTPLPSGNFKPYIFIANYWDDPPTDNKVIVYANVDEVSLLVNGKEIARQKCDDGPDTPYSVDKEMWYKGGNPFDGGNCKNLDIPPFTFKNVKWEKGEIKAIGFIDGKEVCQTAVRIPEEPTGLNISYFESGKAAAENDLIIVYVIILDKNGTLCVNDSSNVTLKVKRGGELIGPRSMDAEAGIVSFLVKTDVDNRLEMEANTTFAKKQKVIKLKY